MFSDSQNLLFGTQSRFDSLNIQQLRPQRTPKHVSSNSPQVSSPHRQVCPPPCHIRSVTSQTLHVFEVFTKRLPACAVSDLPKHGGKWGDLTSLGHGGILEMITEPHQVQGRKFLGVGIPCRTHSANSPSTTWGCQERGGAKAFDVQRSKKIETVLCEDQSPTESFGVLSSVQEFATFF
jgi:hypothetical protein